MRLTVIPDILALFAAQIPLSAAAVFFGIAVQDLFPVSLFRNADAVIKMGRWCKITNNNDLVFRPEPLAHKDQDTLVIMARVKPLKPFIRKIDLIERLFLPVETVQ